ncbi:MAG: large subunit ribosomal protein L17 [Lentimonas sp.]|jgi:large subunit ribosomal protein L17
MRHSKRRHKLGVSGPHRLALLANLSVALIVHGRIKTTLAKAKALRPFVEKVITLAKKAKSSNEAERKLHYRRLAISRINNPDAVATLFDERAIEFMERPGGYTRIYKIGQRIGDAAEMALIELIDGNDEGYSKRPAKKAAEKSVKKGVEKAEKENSAPEVDQPAAATVEEATITEEADVEAEATVDNAKELSGKKSASDAELTADALEVDESDPSSPEDKKKK